MAHLYTESTFIIHFLFLLHNLLNLAAGLFDSATEQTY